jgi:predicted PurR-regulated permease PerM
VGPLLAAIPAVLVALTVSPTLALGVALYSLVLQLLENNVLVPKVMGETVGLSAVTVIVSLFIGSELLGFVGALLAVPTAAIIQVLFEEVYPAEKDPE